MFSALPFAIIVTLISSLVYKISNQLEGWRDLEALY